MAAKGERGHADSRQLSLDDYYVVPQPPEPTLGSLKFDAELCATLSQALKDSPHSRHEIAAKMSDLTGDEITIHMLNAWTAESRERHRFPLEYVPAFEVAAETTALQLLIARKRGTLVLASQAARDAELGHVRRKIKELQKKERILLRAGGDR